MNSIVTWRLLILYLVPAFLLSSDLTSASSFCRSNAAGFNCIAQAVNSWLGFPQRPGLFEISDERHYYHATTFMTDHPTSSTSRRPHTHVSMADSIPYAAGGCSKFVNWLDVFSLMGFRNTTNTAAISRGRSDIYNIMDHWMGRRRNYSVGVGSRSRTNSCMITAENWYLKMLSGEGRTLNNRQFVDHFFLFSTFY